MWRKLAIGAGAAVALAALILGPTGLWNTLRGAREVAREHFEDAKSDAQRVAEIRVGLKDLDDKIVRFSGKLSSITTQAAAAERRLKELEADLEKQRGLLTRAKALLDEEKESYTIGGQPYTRVQLNADALARLSHCERLVKRIEIERQAAKALADTVASSRTNLAKAQLTRQQKAAELTALEARLENARMLAQVNALAHELKASPLEAQSELAKQFEALQTRVEQEEQRARLDSTERPGSLIDWDGKAGRSAEAGEAIARFLGNGSAKAAR
jgi:hypothetical protein